MEKEFIFWDVAKFSVFIKSKYDDLYDLEEDVDKLFGSSNFSELDSLDWFLLNKDTQELSFLLLSVPSFFHDLGDSNLSDIDKLNEVKLADCIDEFVSEVTIQEKAYFSSKENILIATSDLSLIRHKTLISDNLYLLLDEDFSYQGFLLNDATNHIPSSFEGLEDEVLMPLLLRMLALCNQDSYDAMDDKDENYLSLINKLEDDCLHYLNKDDRLIQIIDFLKVMKYTFYDIEIE